MKIEMIANGRLLCVLITIVEYVEFACGVKNVLGTFVYSKEDTFHICWFIH